MLDSSDKLLRTEPAVAPQPASVFIPRRIVTFVNDEGSMLALRTGLDGVEHQLEFKRGNVRNAVRLLENDTELHAVVADISGIDDPAAALEDLARVCPADVMVAIIGDSTDITF